VVAQAYKLLGLTELSDNAVKVLATNYPEYPNLDANGEFDFDKRLVDGGDSLLSKVTFGLIERAQPPAFDTRAIYDRTVRDSELIGSNGEKIEEKRSVLSWLTFGLMD